MAAVFYIKLQLQLGTVNENCISLCKCVIVGNLQSAMEFPLRRRYLTRLFALTNLYKSEQLHDCSTIALMM